ncbi:glyoxalase [Vibrio zhanjiangensis]|uniref:Glyoxalase n=2 Tax=Vibrio zhanjiangensis TaxID=1046128 RepID=A0ABQ6F0S6_9VIBR|nr:glyoxalase [Vibrio zhanjiangensis]
MLMMDSVVLYVQDVQVSQDFYTQILGCDSKALSATCVEIIFANDTRVLLKQSKSVVPESQVTGGGSELSILVADQITFQALYQSWKTQSVEFAQQPAELPFGMSFVAQDPDEHRIRVTLLNKIAA